MLKAAPVIPNYLSPAQASRARRLASRSGPKAAVILKCWDCSGWDWLEARRCIVTSCPLYTLSRSYFRVKNDDGD